MSREQFRWKERHQSGQPAVTPRASCLAAVASALLMLGLAGPAHAATATQNLTVNATVSATASLTLGSGSINFASANPTTTPSITANENPVSVIADAQTSAAGAVTLTCLAGGDLTAGSNTIAISNVTWTVTGTGFVAGTMNKTTAQSAGSWTGSGARSGTFSYSLANSWNYATGSYTATVTYTLTAP